MEPEIIYDSSDTPEAPTCSAVNSELQVFTYFPTSIYVIERPEYLDAVKEVALDAVPEEAKDYDELFPVIMSGQMFADPRIDEFVGFVGKTAFDILDHQGVAMENYHMFFTEMWMQEHHKHSLMEQHSHAGQTQIVGFYFLETPEKCSPLILHDPRPAKVQVGLFQKNPQEISYTSDQIVIWPKPGMLVFTNAWLPHSFGRHGTDEPIRFVHFNLGCVPRMNPNQVAPEEPQVI